MINISKMRKKRLELGISVTDIVKKLGLKHEQSYYNWENGTSKPNYETIKKLLKVFDCKFEDLF